MENIDTNICTYTKTQIVRKSKSKTDKEYDLSYGMPNDLLHEYNVSVGKRIQEWTITINNKLFEIY